MKKISLLVVIASLSLSSMPSFSSEGVFKSIEHFQELRVGKLPISWRTWPFRRGKAADVYAVAEEPGNRFLRATETQEHSVELLRNFEWQIREHPVFSWRWRATLLPKGAKESDPNLNDSACGVYVILGRFDGHAIKYVWSTTLPVGTVVTRKEGKLKIKVLDSGEAKLNTWQQYTIDVLKDYKELFGVDLEKNPSGIGILTDGNATHSHASCDYDDFEIGSQPGAK